jgi:putative FmdB family regulatory protein
LVIDGWYLHFKFGSNQPPATNTSGGCPHLTLLSPTPRIRPASILQETWFVPLYEYQCKACHHRFEKIQKFSDPLVTECPECGEDKVEQMISAPAVQFKGTGWYVTDYAKKGSHSASASNSDSKSESKTESKSDSKSESKTETKSETKKTSEKKD